MNPLSHNWIKLCSKVPFHLNYLNVLNVPFFPFTFEFFLTIYQHPHLYKLTRAWLLVNWKHHKTHLSRVYYLHECYSPLGHAQKSLSPLSCHARKSLYNLFWKLFSTRTETSPQSFSEAIFDVRTKATIGGKRRIQEIGNACGGEWVGMVGNSCMAEWVGFYGRQFQKARGRGVFQCRDGEQQWPCSKDSCDCCTQVVHTSLLNCSIKLQCLQGTINYLYQSTVGGSWPVQVVQTHSDVYHACGSWLEKVPKKVSEARM